MVTATILSLTAVALCVSVYYNYKFARIIFRAEDAIEESLDALDERFQALSEISKRPVFFDSVEVRQVIAELNLCRDTVLTIAKKLTTVGEANGRSPN